MTEAEKAARLAALQAERDRRLNLNANAGTGGPPAAPVQAAPVAQNRQTPQSGPDTSALISALVTNGGINTDQKRAIDFAFDVQDRGREAEDRARRDAERSQEEALSEGVAGFALNRALDPTAEITPGALLSDPALADLSYNDRINAVIRSTELFDGPLQGVINPEIQSDLISNTAADDYRRSADARVNNSLQARLLRDAEAYAGDPVNGLIRELEIGRDGETRDDFDRLNLDRYIDRLSTEYGIPPERVAVAMNESFVRDPGGNRGEGWFGFDLTRNTIENRFPEERIRDYIETNLSPEAMNAHFSRVSANQDSQRRLGMLQSELTDLRTTAERYRQLGQEIPPELQVAISDTQSRIRTWGQVPDTPEPEPERDPNPNDTVTEERMREAITYSNNYFTDAGIMPYIVQMRQNPDQREATLERIGAHLQGDNTLTADQKRILWAVANQ